MQTDLNLYLGFPWSCEHARFEGATHEAYGEESAFWCEGMITLHKGTGREYTTYLHGSRIVESECMGMKCPACKVRKAEEIADLMAGMLVRHTETAYNPTRT